MNNIPTHLLNAFDETGRIKTLALFAQAVSMGFIFDTSGNDKTKGKRLARLLAGWNIKPRTIRFPDKIANGYVRAEFAWVVKTGQPLPPHFIC